MSSALGEQRRCAHPHASGSGRARALACSSAPISQRTEEEFRAFLRVVRISEPRREGLRVGVMVVKNNYYAHRAK
jgi:hypothetical protein